MKLWINDPHCYWCGVETINPIGPQNGVLTADSATIDHIYSRLDPRRREPHHYGETRTVLSCYACNHERGREQNEGSIVHVGTSVSSL